MAELIYFDTNVYEGMDALFNALKSIPNFWDSTSEEENKRLLVKGGVTLEISALQTKGFYGYGRAVTVGFDNQKTYLIAATANGLIFDAGGSAGSYYGIALGVDDNGVWGAVKFNTSVSSSFTINDILAPNVDSTTYNKDLYTSIANTQIIDLMSIQGDYIFKDIRRILSQPSGVRGYRGKLTMPNGEKYVQCGSSVVLRYT